jgi:hypothetical protein
MFAIGNVEKLKVGYMSGVIFELRWSGVKLIAHLSVIFHVF